jgi:hypothetical protein
VSFDRGTSEPWTVQLLILDDRDTIAIATVDLRVGDHVEAAGASFVMRDDVIRGHKVALRRMPMGTDVLRYGEVIGAATSTIEMGDHVHVHNLISRRLPGRAT